MPLKIIIKISYLKIDFILRKKKKYIVLLKLKNLIWQNILINHNPVPTAYLYIFFNSKSKQQSPTLVKVWPFKKYVMPFGRSSFFRKKHEKWQSSAFYKPKIKYLLKNFMTISGNIFVLIINMIIIKLIKLFCIFIL